MPEFCYRVFRQGADVLLAISDSSIVGKTFEEGDLQIHASKEFYCDERCGREDAVKLMKSATIVNAVGNKIIGLMTKENLVDKDSILVIKGISHAQVVTIK